MASWVTHLMIADRLLEAFPTLDRRGFCVGCIAPDCNVENEDWSAFTPPREVTHWMSGTAKGLADSERFCAEYLSPRLASAASPEERAFLLGYYAHLIEDAEYQRFIRDPERIRAVWQRIRASSLLSGRAAGLPETWDAAKQLVSKREREREIHALEARYLKTHPHSGYITEILPLKRFPDYVDYLPHGCIVRKIRVMGALPEADDSQITFLCFSPEEHVSYVDSAFALVARALLQHNFVS